METTIALAIIGVALCCATGPALTLFVAFRFGLVGGSPRELLSMQLQTESVRQEIESRKLKLEEEIAELRARQQRVMLEAKEHELKNPPPPPQQRVMNPQGGPRSAFTLPPPPPSRNQGRG